MTTEPLPFTLTAASDAEKQARDAVTFAEWGTRLSLEQFKEREARLRAHRWSRDAMRTWLLRDASGEVLSSCETFLTDCRVDGAWGQAWQIASVFTEPHLRGRGHATRMLSLLVEQLGREPGLPLAVTLYSDVGAPIYERCGFRAVEPPHDWLLSPVHGDPGVGVELITGEVLASAHAAIRPPASPVLLWPSADELDWHLERERIYAQMLGGPRPVAWGARAGDVVGLWAVSSRGGSLEVLVLGDGELRAQRAVLEAARRVAAQAGLSQVRLWEDPLSGGEPPARALGGVRKPREGSLPMLHPLSPRASVGGWHRLPRGLWV